MCKVSIIGCGGHARSIADVLLGLYPNLKIVFYDDNIKTDGERILGHNYAKPIVEFSDKKEEKVILGIGDNHKRSIFYNKIKEAKKISVVSQNACISEYAYISEGVFIANQVHVGPLAKIGEDTIINTGAIVEHECTVGIHSHISVGAKICGRSSIGDYVMIGAGATVIDKVSVCSEVVVGAGAVVVSDIVDSGVYVGVPAKRLYGLKCNPLAIL